MPELFPSPYNEIALVTITILIAVILNFIIFRSLRVVTKKWEIQRNLIARVARPFLGVLIMAGLLLDYHLLKLELLPLSQLLHILIIFFITWTLVRLTHLSGQLMLSQYNIDQEDNLKARKVYTQIKVFERIAFVVIIVIGLGLGLMTFDSIRHFGVSLLTSAGIAGIIIGLAAQRLILNILAGMQIAITQPIRIDDVVIVEGEWGWIEEITLTFVSVRIWDKRRLIVPSTYFIEKPFQNWTRQSADILGTVFLYTDYKLPLDPLRKEIERLLANTDLWDGQVNVTQVTNANDRTMEVRVLVSAADSPKAWDLRVYLREELIRFIQENYPEYLPKTRIDLNQENSSPKP